MPLENPASHSSSRRRFAAIGAAIALLALTTGCLAVPGKTDQVELVSSRTVNGWQYDFYRNNAYPCSISGSQTFVVGTKVGSSATATKPLWVKMRGGGVGWFDATGKPEPSAGNKTEQSFDTLLGFDTPGLMASVKAAPEGFRILLVSMCSHDIYAGNNNPDPHNPNTTPDGNARPTTGLISTKAAIQFTEAKYPTNDYFLHGTSAGGYGTFSVAYALQQQGIPPTGIVADSGVLNQAWQRYIAEHGVSGSPGCEMATDDRAQAVIARTDPEIADPANQPDQLVSRGALTVPIMHVWDHADSNACGDAPIECPLPDGTSVTMGAAECAHEPLRLAIAAQGPNSRSRNMGVCVEGSDASTPCDRHVVTTVANGVNSDPANPADYQAAILDWVRIRLADD